MLALGFLLATQAQAADVFTPGFVKREMYTGLTGVLVDDLRAAEKYPASPDQTGYVPGLETPQSVADNYGVRLSGYITAPASGSYKFYISADDGAEFWLSTDATPSNLQLLCSEPQWNNPRDWRTPGANATGRNVDAPENVSEAKSLTLGQRYYFEALMKEGGGGDNLAVAVAPAGDPVPASGTPPASGSWIGVNISDAGASVQVTQQPASVSVQANQSASFSVKATTASPLSTSVVYEWRRNGVPIAGATASTLNLTGVQASENATRYSALIAVPGAFTISSEATLTVTPDIIPPTIVSARGTANRKGIDIVFSEPVEAASATSAGNYQLSGGVAVTAAKLVNSTSVQLTTGTQGDGAELTLTVNGVKDSFVPGNPIAANTKVVFKSWTFQAGQILNRFWDNFGGNSIAGLRALPTFPNQPDRVRFESAYEYPPDGAPEGGSNYGNMMEAWWTPPSSGDYVFYCSGDDPVNLFLSTDDDPANAKLVAVEPQWNNPRDWVGADRRPETENRSDVYTGTQWPSGSRITLDAARRYYILALHTEGGGGDNVGVKAVRTTAGDPANGDPPLPGNQLGYYYDPTDSQVTIASSPASQQIAEGRPATLTVTAAGKWQWSSTPFYQWQSSPTVGGTMTDIPGATSASYTTPVNSIADSGKSYRVRVYVPGAESLSSGATLTVVADKVAPKIVSVKATGSDSLNVTFDEALDTVTAQAAGNYAMSGGISVTGALLTGDGANVVILDLGSPVANGSTYTLTVNGVKDRYNNAASGEAKSFTARPVTYADVIKKDGPIAFYRFEEASGSKATNEGTRGTVADGIYMAADSEGTAKNATGPTPASGFAGFSKSNKAGVFDGAADWVDTTQPLLNGLRAFSLEYWVKPVRTNDVGEVWSGGGAGGGSANRVGIVGQNDAIEYGFINMTTIQIWTPGGGALNSTYPYKDNEWHHIATIAEGPNIKNYFDGVLVGTGGSNIGGGTYGTSTFNVRIGGGGVFDGGGNFFRGQIDEVAIFDKAIPASRVAAHYNAGKNGGEETIEAARFTSVTAAGGNVIIAWTGQGTLQSAPVVTGGTWTPIPNAPNPYSAPASGAPAFFRIVSE